MKANLDFLNREFQEILIAWCLELKVKNYESKVDFYGVRYSDFIE